MRTVSAVLAFLFLACVSASAQDNFEWRIYGGYQYSRVDTTSTQTFLNATHLFNPAIPAINYGTRQNLNGWDVGIEQDGRWGIGAVVDFSGGYESKTQTISSVGGVTNTARTRLHMYTATAGPQFVMRRSSQFQPFAHALLGAAWYRDTTSFLSNNIPLVPDFGENDTRFTVGAGGGVNVFFSKNIGLRVAGDYFRTFFFDARQNNFRGTAGLVIRF